MEQTQQIKKINKKTRSGVVVSDKMDKTVIVSVSRFVKHPKYGKYRKVNKRYKAHDENNNAKIGDSVVIEECKLISKGKSFKIVSTESLGLKTEDLALD